MYDNIDYLAVTKAVFERVVKRERMKYSPLYRILLEALSAAAEDPTNAAFIADALAAEAYDARKIDLESIVEVARPLVVYTAEPYDFGSNLMRNNRASFGKFIMEMTLYPAIPELEYYLQVPGRKLCILRRLGEYRDLPLTKLIRPISVPIGGMPVPLISPELILIDIYRRIFFSPPASTLPEQLGGIDFVRLERRLFDRLIGEYHSGKLGGDESLTTNSPAIISLRRAIMEAFNVGAKDTVDAIVIGQQALTPDSSLGFLQLVSLLPDHVIRQRLEGAVEAWIGDRKHKINFETMRYYLSIPSDTRLRRFRLFLTVPGDSKKGRIAVVDIFNAANYDVLALHSYTYLRFILVDIWTIVLIRNLGEITEDVAERQLARLITLAKAARSSIKPLDTLTPADFFGLHIDEGVAARREKKNIRKDHDSIVYGALLS